MPPSVGSSNSVDDLATVPSFLHSNRSDLRLSSNLNYNLDTSVNFDSAKGTDPCLITTQELVIKQPLWLDLWQQKQLLHVYKLIFYQVGNNFFDIIVSYVVYDCVACIKPASAH